MCSMEIMSIPSISKVVRGWHLESGMDPTRSVSFLVPSVGYSLFFFYTTRVCWALPLDVAEKISV